MDHSVIPPAEVGSRASSKRSCLATCGCGGCGCLSILALLILCNPMLLMFLTEVRIKNESGERVYVTCGGVLQSGGLAVLHPRFLYKGIPAVPLFSRTEERIEPGRSLKVVYDWDDINFAWIVVRGEAGRYRVIKTGASEDPKECCSRGAANYRIPRLSTLPEAPGDLLRELELRRR